MSAQVYDWPPRRRLDTTPEQVAADARSFYEAMDTEFLDSTPPRTDGSVAHVTESDPADSDGWWMASGVLLAILAFLCVVSCDAGCFA